MTSLAEEYRQKQRELDERLRKEIDAHTLAQVPQQQQSTGLPFEKKPQQFVRS